MTFLTVKASAAAPMNVLDFASGVGMSYLLDSSGYLWTAGDNTNYAMGMLGNTTSHSPMQNAKPFTKVVATRSYAAAALDSSSFMWAWGTNDSAQGCFHPSNNSYFTVPFKLPIQTAMLKAGGNHFMLRDSSSYLWSMGLNTYGQLGTNTVAGASTPVSVIGGRKFIKFDAGTPCSYGLDSSSYLWAWGYNGIGCLGDNTVANKSSPVSVVGGRKFIDISCSNESSQILAIDESSYGWAWGDNTYGQLGDNTLANKSSPVSIVGGVQWAKLFSTVLSSWGIDVSGNVYVWGYNGNYIFGNGSTINRSSPIVVKYPFNIKNVIGLNYGSIQGTGFLDTSSNVWAAGNFTNGMAGMGGTGAYPVPTLIKKREYDYSPFQAAKAKSLVLKTAALLLDTSSVAWVWGLQNSSYGFYGNGTMTNSSTPTMVAGGKKFLQVDANNGVCAGIDENNDIYFWGGCNNYQAGSFNKTLSIPTMYINGKKWLGIAIGPATARAIDTSSFLWSWGGSNGYGQLGDNTVANRSSPVSVVGGRKFKDVVMADDTTTLALDISGYAWAWGNNGNGQLGDNTLANRSSPVSVVGGRKFISICITGNACYGLDESSYLWAWGYNGNGHLGDNTIANRSSPVSVVGGRKFMAIPRYASANMIAAIDISSYAWAWGYNGSGYLGDGSVLSRSSPTSVVGGNLWSTVGCTDDSGIYGLTDNNEAYFATGTYHSIGYYQMNVPSNFSAPLSSPTMMTWRYNYISSPVVTKKRDNIFGR